MNTLVTLVIPFYNEELSLIELLPRVKDNLEQSGIVYEVLLINDASTDGSNAVVEKFIIENYKKIPSKISDIERLLGT